MTYLQSLSDPRVAAARRPANVFRSPEDWRDVWIYFLLVDRFNAVNAPQTNGDLLKYQGGTFAGIVAQLPYLKKLGVGALWLSPVLMNPQWFPDFYGGYMIEDFLRVEPRFCSSPTMARADPTAADAELRRLVDAAHDLGIHVIFDIVLNHAANLFSYPGQPAEPPWSAQGEYAIRWRDAAGVAQPAWHDIGVAPGDPDVGPWPAELRRNDFFRRRGLYDERGDVTRGDFGGGFKELVTEYLRPQKPEFPVRDALIRAYQYLIGKFDVDGYRIDTLMYVERDFARTFGSAMREYALSIGKKNFLTFGEVWKDDDEEAIARFVGRDTTLDDERVGVDAAIDFPVRKRLVEVCKGRAAPAELARWFDVRRAAQRKIVSSHSDASAYFVTFLDNHDLNERFHWPAMPDQTTLALGCLFTLQGIPCVYYGTEQGLAGRGATREAVREVLWSQPNAFSTAHPLHVAIQKLSALRASEPALRYGRMYMRPVSGNGTDFGYSEYPGGVLAYSRILDDREVVIVANASTTTPFSGFVHVDPALSPPGRSCRVLWANQSGFTPPKPVAQAPGRCALPVQLRPMELQVLG